MPFKKTHQQGSFPSEPLFIGRDSELLFFVQQILKPEEPFYNILSIRGQGGVGKTTLLHRFKALAEAGEFAAYSVTALVDERQTTPARMMEKFAQQMPFSGDFAKALNRYKEAIQMQPLSWSTSSLQQTIIDRTPDVAGASLEGIPFAGPLLREGAKMATEHLLDRYRTSKESSDAALFDSPLETLTQRFLAELNRLAAAKGTLRSTKTKRERRILLFFDAFEHIAEEAVPWLLYFLLPLNIHHNIVLILAGRDPLERSLAAGPKLWLRYYEDHTLYDLPLHSFTQEETSDYLVKRGITVKEKIEDIWHLSRGLPLYLGLLSTNTQEAIDPTKDVVDNFLNRLSSSEPTKRRLALDAALFSKPFTFDDLEAFLYLSEQDRSTLYDWLLQQTFIQESSLQGRYVYHDLVQELFQRYLFQHFPKMYSTTRRALATYYQGVLEHLQTVVEKERYGPSDERLDVMLALAYQRFLLPEEESHLQALSPLLDILESGDAEQEQVLFNMLRETALILSRIQAGTHAYRVTQKFIDYLEICPSDSDLKDKQAWLTATNHLLILTQHSSSSELRAKVYEHIGGRYHLHREYQQAIASYEYALDLHPRLASAYAGLGSVYHSLKAFQQAVGAFDQGLELAPFHPYIYIGRCRTYKRLKAYQEALRDVNHALQLDGRIGVTYHNRACIYMELKDYGKALADWDRLLEVAPQDPFGGYMHFYRGCAYLWLKELSRATACFTHSHELVPTENLILWAKEWSMMCQASPGPETLLRLDAIAKGNGYIASVCKGVVFFLQKKFKPALAELQYAVTVPYDEKWSGFPGSDRAEHWHAWDAHFWLSMTYLALDQGEEAHAAIGQALALEMPPMLLKPLIWFEQEKPELYEQFVKPLLASYERV